MQSTIEAQPMADKVCLVTGATAGIGKITAMALAVQGASVIVGGRNRQKAAETVREIITETGNDSVDYLLADFSELQQVRGMAVAFQERYSRLDVLVNNAGAFFNRRQITPYGVERTFLVNHLAPFLLTNLLLDSILASPSARIINVSSNAHRQGSMDFGDLGFRRGYVGIRAYARSKLANVLFTYELVRRLDTDRITVNAVHPGHVATDIWKTNFSFIGPALKWATGLIALTPEEGADNSIYLASSLAVEDTTGEYFVKREPAPSSPLSYDEEVARQLWEISAALSGLLSGKSTYHRLKPVA
jgi:retinol dehydrogenase-12